MRGPPQLSVLFVEDHDEIREALASVLVDEGYLVRAVATAEEGLEELSRAHFDLVLTDYSLPGETGSWMVLQARQRGWLVRTALLMVTAHPQPESVEGMEVLRKPIELDPFLVKIAEVIAGVRAEPKRSLSA